MSEVRSPGTVATSPPPAPGALKSIALLMSGTMVAQVVPVLLSPVLTRLYSPADYGALAWALSLVTVAVLVGTGTYEHAINLPPDRSTALAIAAGAMLGGLAVTALLVVASCLEASQSQKWPHRLWFVPVATLLMLTFNCGNAWANREARFKLIARSRVLLALITTGATLLFGMLGWGEFGLMAGTVLGLLAGASAAMLGVLAHDRALIRALHGTSIRAALRSHLQFPRWQLPASLVDTLATQLPIWFLGRLFGPAVLGQFALLNRVLNVPSALVSTSIGEVFRQRAAAEFRTTGQCREIFRTFGGGLAIASLLPTLALLVAGPELFVFVFGKAWRTAGEFSRIFAVLFALRLTIAPLTYVILLAQRQRLNLVIHGLFLAGALLAWGWAAHAQSAPEALLVYVVAHALVYLFYIEVCRRLARGIT